MVDPVVVNGRDYDRTNIKKWLDDPKKKQCDFKGDKVKNYGKDYEFQESTKAIQRLCKKARE